MEPRLKRCVHRGTVA